MPKLSKRVVSGREKIARAEFYPLDEALEKVKECADAKFAESVDVSINLGVDPRKSDQVVRGAAELPHGTGKSIRVAVFAQGDAADAAREAGADIVGLDDLADDVKKGNIDFDVAIAAPDAMRVVGQLGRVLGPRGLMPNPKVGTVSPNVAEAVTKAKAGQVRFRTDKAGIIHCTIGKAKFESQALKENLDSVLKEVVKLKPSSAKGIYVKKVSVSSTMGPGVAIDKASLEL